MKAEWLIGAYPLYGLYGQDRKQAKIVTCNYAPLTEAVRVAECRLLHVVRHQHQ